MSTSLVVGLALISIFLFAIVKLLLGLKSESRLLTYDFPTGWEEKINLRFPLFKILNDKQKINFKKKVQLLIAKRTIIGLESLSINIDIRLAIASEIALLTINEKKMNPYSKLNPIAILPFEKYEEFKNRSSYTLYWNEQEQSIYMETPNNKLLKNSFYLFLKVDKRLKETDESLLEEMSNLLTQSTFPSAQDSKNIFSISNS